MGSWMLGLGGSDHDFSSALMAGYDIRVAIEQERLSRRKHGLSLWYEDPVRRAIDYCLKAENVPMEEVRDIVASDSLPSRVRRDLQNRNLKTFPHHLCHAASAYMMLPHGSKAGVIVYDGFGSIRKSSCNETFRNARETFSFFVFSKDGYRCIGTTEGLAYSEPEDFPTGVTNSIGMLYELVTAVLGYDVMDSGKTMGLAAYGVPMYVDLLENFISYGDTPSNCFHCASDNSDLPTALEKVLFARRSGFDVRADLAASVQFVVNKTLLHCERFFAGSDIDYLCVSGGCALNTVANSFLVEHSKLGVPIFIPPHCGDAGLGLGAMWLALLDRGGSAPQLTINGQTLNPHLSRPGRRYLKEERCDAVRQFYPRIVFDPSVTSPTDLAQVIANGAVVGVFTGGSELGPRALGGRSIIADPRNVRTRERINRIIKHREPFRPLAPIVLDSNYEDYFFNTQNQDHFMLKTARVRERGLRDAPALVHVDHTARVQVVTDYTSTFLSELLRAFRQRTGVGLLINTSFNRRGEPIVETPLDAVDAFLGMGLDGLYLDGEFYLPAMSTSPRD